MPEETYQYPIEERVQVEVPTMRLGMSDEELTGEVQGHRASKWEEMAAGILDNLPNVLGYIFQYEIQTAFSSPDHPNKVDFMVNIGGMYRPLEIDHEWTHKTGEQIEYDRVRDSILNEEFRQQGILEIVRILVTDFTTKDEMYRLIQEAL